MPVQPQIRRRSKDNSEAQSSGVGRASIPADGSGQRGCRGGNRIGSGEISFLGPEPIPVIQMLRVFDQTAEAFAESLTSLRQVSEYLEQLSFRGEYPDDLPYGTSSLSRYCQAAEEYFGRHFELPGKAELFIRKNRGESIIGLTKLGVEAWALCHDFLVWYGVVKE